MTAPNPAAFEALADTYDADFTHSRLGRLLRRRVWNVLTSAFAPGSHVLELACGTGEDALWLAKHGLRVTAFDGSPAMVRRARAKVQAAGFGDSVTVQERSLQEIGRLPPALRGPFQGLFSNFGGLNTVAHWPRLAEDLAPLVQPGGKAILVPMGPFCPWEMAWFLLQGKGDEALRRRRQPATARLGDELIPVWYPSLRRLKSALAPWFQLLSVESLGLWLPPSYLGHWVERHPRLFQALNRLEAATGHLSGGWGDHYIAVFERRPIPPAGSRR